VTGSAAPAEVSFQIYIYSFFVSVGRGQQGRSVPVQLERHALCCRVTDAMITMHRVHAIMQTHSVRIKGDVMCVQRSAFRSRSRGSGGPVSCG
jgi:hypothetical protein